MSSGGDCVVSASTLSSVSVSTGIDTSPVAGS